MLRMYRATLDGILLASPVAASDDGEGLHLNSFDTFGCLNLRFRVSNIITAT